MKKDNRTSQDQLREEYVVEDFKKPMVRGTYAEKILKSSNIVVLHPEVAKAFPNEEAVNNALKALIDVAKANVRGATR